MWRNSSIMPPWVPPVASILSSIAGTIGAILIGFSVGAPPGVFAGRVVGTRPDGTPYSYNLAYVLSPRRFWFGIALIGIAFAIQAAAAGWSLWGIWGP